MITSKTTESGFDNVVFFPVINTGMPRQTSDYLRDLVIVSWHLMISGRTIIEDIEGSIESSEYMHILKIILIEMCFNLDCRLKQSETPNDLHSYALAMELGLSDLARIEPDQMDKLFSISKCRGSKEEYQEIQGFWDAALRAFPSDLPNPLVAGRGQGDLIIALRCWSDILEKNNIDSGFLAELYKTI